MTEYEDVLAFLKLAYKRRRCLFISDVSEALGMSYDRAKKVTDRLRAEGKIKYTDGPKFTRKRAS